MTATDKFDANKIGDEIKEHVAQIEKAEGSLIEHKRAAAALLQDVALNHKEHLTAVCERAGLGKSRTKELMSIALGRKTAQQVKDATKRRVADYRAKKKARALPKPKPEPEPKAAVTSDVTATPEPSAEAHKAEHAQAKHDPRPEPRSQPKRYTMRYAEGRARPRVVTSNCP
jgi:hypothetical protein